MKILFFGLGAILIAVTIGVVIASAIKLWDQPAHCRDFISQAEAQKAFEAGETQLDGNKNSKACEVYHY